MHARAHIHTFLRRCVRMRAQHAQRYKAMSNTEVTKSLGKDWNLLSTEEQLPYILEAAHRHKQQKRIFPNYTYVPRKKGAKKGWVNKERGLEMNREPIGRQKQRDSLFPIVTVLNNHAQQCQRNHKHPINMVEQSYFTRTGICVAPELRCSSDATSHQQSNQSLASLCSCDNSDKIMNFQELDFDKFLSKEQHSRGCDSRFDSVHPTDPSGDSQENIDDLDPSSELSFFSEIDSLLCEFSPSSVDRMEFNAQHQRILPVRPTTILQWCPQ
jgi:hypothetical protein